MVDRPVADLVAEGEAVLAAATRREIPDFPGYVATDAGEIWSVATNWRGYGGRSLMPHPRGDGYLAVRVQDAAGRRRKVGVHKLVALAFHGPRPPGLQVRHRNGDRLDNRPANLIYGTAKENADDRDEHGRTRRGEGNSTSKLTEEQVREIRRLAAEGMPARQIAPLFGVHNTTIAWVVRRGRWRHVA